MKILGTRLGLPVVTSFPGSPAKGDAVVLDSDGLVYVYDGTQWVPGGVTSLEPQGFATTATTDHYTSPNAAWPGANDFVAVAAWVNTGPIDGGKIMPIVSSSNGSSGWAMCVSYGILTVYAYVAGFGLIQATADANLVPPLRRRGHLIPIGLRFYGAGPGVFASIECWIGPARYEIGVSGAFGSMGPATGPLYLGGTDPAGFFFDNVPSVGALLGLGYYEGTVTTEEMRRIMGRVQATAAIPEDLLAWDGVIQGPTMFPVASTFVSDVGSVTFTKQGSPTAIRSYFPSGGAGNHVVPPAGGGGGGLTTYDVLSRQLALGT